MEKRDIQDKYNKNKVWNITHTSCGHYYLSQTIKGKQFGKRIRVTLKWLKNLLPDSY